MLAYTRMLYMPRAIDKMGAAMESAIEKKVAANPVRTEPKKNPEDNLQHSDRIRLEDITKSDFEIFAASIRATKRELKPASSTKVCFKLMAKPFQSTFLGLYHLQVKEVR